MPTASGFWSAAPERVPTPSMRNADARRTRRWRRTAPLLATAVVAVFAAACMPPAGPSGPANDAAQAMNDDRSAAGVAPLAWDGQLAMLAQRHADELAASGHLWHSDLGGWLDAPWMSNWYALGENLAEAPAATSGAQIEDLWMASPPHQANLLNGGFNKVGVGTTVDGTGRVWAVAVFGTG